MLQQSEPPGAGTGAVPDEVYVSGVLVHALPGQIDAVRSWIGTLPGAIVHGAADGKLVVTLEANGARALVDQLDALRARPGVVSALPVYQHNEPAAGIDLEEGYGN